MRPRGRVTALHIERVVIDGISLGPAEARHLQEALESELSRLLGGPTGALPVNDRTTRIDLRAPVTRGLRRSTPAELGTQIALGVQHALAPPRSPGQVEAREVQVASLRKGTRTP